jgi:hypothetical protein
MRNIKLIMALLIVLPVILTNVCFAVSLDDSAQKQVTVRTEIQRGYNAVVDVNSQVIKTGEDVDDLVRSILSKNEQANTDTEPFKLGVYLKTWQTYSQNVEADTITFYKANDPIFEKDQLLRKQAKPYFAEYRKIQTSLALDDKTICEAVGIKYEDIQIVLRNWDLVKQ